MVIDYKQWAINMLRSGRCDTFGKQMLWLRRYHDKSLKDLSIDTRISVQDLCRIERDEHPMQVLLWSAKKKINNVMPTPELD